MTTTTARNDARTKVNDHAAGHGQKTTATDGTAPAKAKECKLNAENHETAVTEDSIFLKIIPPELRNEIYALVLTQNDDIIIPTTGNLDEPALLRVCKQIRSEATALYYESNNFRAMVSHQACTGPSVWIDHVDEHVRKHVRRLTVEYEYVWKISELTTFATRRVLHRLHELLSNTANDFKQCEDEKTYWLSWSSLLLQLHQKGLALSCLSFDAPDRAVNMPPVNDQSPPSFVNDTTVRGIARSIWKGMLGKLRAEVLLRSKEQSLQAIEKEIEGIKRNLRARVHEA